MTDSERFGCEWCGQSLTWHVVTTRGPRIVVLCERGGAPTRSFAKADVLAVARMVGIDTRKATY